MRRALFGGVILLGAAVLLGAQPAEPRGPGGGDAKAQGMRRGNGEGRRAGGKAREGRAPKGPGAGRGKGPALQGADGRESPRAGRGNMFLRQGSTRAAVSSFRKQLEANPDSAALHIGLGKALVRIGQCEEGLDHLWPYVGTLPFGAEAALAASTCSSRLGLLDDAIYFDRLAVDMDPKSARALTNLALDLASAGDDAGAEVVLDDLLFLRPDRDASTYARAVLALRAGEIEEFDRITFAWEQTEGPSLDLRRLQAQAWLDLDDPVAAMASLANLRRVRNGQQVRHLRAEAHRRVGYADEASAYLEDRPQSVLEGIDSDAVRVRVFADLGEFAQAHELLAEYEGERGPELAASAWYLARREGRTDELPALAEAYERVRQSPLRDLDELVPWTLR